MRRVNGKRLLVVDDDRDLCDLLAEYLTDEGYEVARAYGGRDALRKARHEKPDALLLDLLMPDLSGTNVARALRSDEETADLPIVVFSGDDASLSLAREILPAGSLAKPFTLDEIGVAVRLALGDRGADGTLAHGAA